MSLLSVRKHIAILLCLLPLYAQAFVPTGVAPAFFGPNALPVPDMSDGRTQEQLSLELAGDGWFGTTGDRTADIFARVNVPLFTRWANVSIWMPVYEWYDQYDGKGGGAGDVYLSTDVQVLHDSWFKSGSRWIPQATVRLAMKTASGEQFSRRRHYDCPAYFFDLNMGNSLYWRNWEFRLSGSVGFLCWQTADARQNDAVMYGIQALARHEYVSLLAAWGGYTGWERYGDAPMTLKLRLAGNVQGFEPYVQYQWGIRDFPYHQIRVGLAYRINVLRTRH